MKEKEKEDEERYSGQKPKRKVLREVEEIDEFGNVRKVLRESKKKELKKLLKQEI